MNPDSSLIEREVLYTYQCCEQIFHFVPRISAEEVVQDFVALSAATRPLRAGEKGIVTVLKPKTAALLGDRVWLQYPGDNPQLDFAFGWSSPRAIRMGALYHFMNSSGYFQDASHSASPESSDEGQSRVEEFLAFTEGGLVEEYSQLSGAHLTPLYDSNQKRDRDHKPGQRAVVVSVVESIGIVSEEALTWEQVIEFRRDGECREAYRRFVHWLDKEMVGKSTGFIVDEVGGRLEAYRWALRKHGLQTVLGAIERTLDAKCLTSAAAATVALETLLHLPLVSILSGAGLLIGNAAVHAGVKLIERNDIVANNKDIAFVHQIKNRLGEA